MAAPPELDQLALRNEASRADVIHGDEERAPESPLLEAVGGGQGRSPPIIECRLEPVRGRRAGQQPQNRIEVVLEDGGRNLIERRVASGESA